MVRPISIAAQLVPSPQLDAAPGPNQTDGPSTEAPMEGALPPAARHPQAGPSLPVNGPRQDSVETKRCLETLRRLDHARCSGDWSTVRTLLTELAPAWPAFAEAARPGAASYAGDVLGRLLRAARGVSEVTTGERVLNTLAIGIPNALDAWDNAVAAECCVAARGLLGSHGTMLAASLVRAEGSATAADARTAIETLLEWFPPPLLARLVDGKISIVICRTKVGDWEMLANDTTPARGYENGATVSDVGGIFWPETRSAVVALQKWNGAWVVPAGNSMNTLVHEALHGLDEAYGYSQSPEFLAAHAAESAYQRSYLQQEGHAGRQEAFATLGTFYLSKGKGIDSEPFQCLNRKSFAYFKKIFGFEPEERDCPRPPR